MRPSTSPFRFWCGCMSRNPLPVRSHSKSTGCRDRRTAEASVPTTLLLEDTTAYRCKVPTGGGSVFRPAPSGQSELYRLLRPPQTPSGFSPCNVKLPFHALMQSATFTARWYHGSWRATSPLSRPAPLHPRRCSCLDDHTQRRFAPPSRRPALGLSSV